MIKFKNTILITTLFLMIITVSSAQKTATYDEVLSKQKKGKIDTYITKNGEAFSVGDTISLGIAFRNDEFNFIHQNAITDLIPLPNTAANSIVVIKKISLRAKTVIVNTTKPQGFIYGLSVINFESALENGEIVSKIMTSDQALEELKKWKEKLDLELISEEEYTKKKEELSKFIK